MCRGTNLGTCCAQDCDARIQCQDTGGYCPAHDLFGYVVDDDDDATRDESAPVVDDPEKRRAYTLDRLNVGITRIEASISADQRRLVDMRSRVRQLADD